MLMVFMVLEDLNGTIRMKLISRNAIEIMTRKVRGRVTLRIYALGLRVKSRRHEGERPGCASTCEEVRERDVTKLDDYYGE